MWYNALVGWLLQSPVHPLMSKSTMLVKYQGRVSGKIYSVPVNYVRLNNVLLSVSWKDRTWWRNLRAASDSTSDRDVTLTLEGLEVKTSAQVLETETAVEESLLEYLSQVPNQARFFNVTLDEQNVPLLSDVRKAAENIVMIRFFIPET